ncbi:MAG: lamin tail domain-containing protein [Phycisphaerales bacterium]|nr:MAG: lamin tail domain-containing protein [Phycisphaerales bacterium]
MLTSARASLLSLALIVSLTGPAEAQPCPVGDLNGDRQVSFPDLEIFAEHWLDSDCSAPDCEADLDGVEGANAPDFALLARSWFADCRPITLVINEFMAKNEGFIQDSWGDYDDWIEIYNYGDYAIDMGGMYLTDDLSQPATWRVPDDEPDTTTIPPHAYLLIWADGERNEGPLHADFKLGAGGEQIGLYDAGGNLIDGLTYGSQNDDESYGRFPDGSDNWRVFGDPTPGAPNADDPIQVVITEIMYHPSQPDSQVEDMREEYIELFNRGKTAVDLSGWRFNNGVDFAFPDVTLGAGEYLAVAADVNAFATKYPGVANVVGGWDGRLSNSGEVIELVNSVGGSVERIQYSDQGDWGLRELGPPDRGHRGWLWVSEHDGGGNSLSLINPAMPNEYGQNWTASAANYGSPGMSNFVYEGNIAPLILDVTHSPIIPRSDDLVAVSARIIDEVKTGVAVTLHYRVDTSVYEDEDIYPQHEPGSYSDLTMYDDGAHGDGEAGDGLYGAEIPPQPDGTIVEFYLETRDAMYNSRTWPGPSLVDEKPEQVTNAFYQVDDAFDLQTHREPGGQPIYYLIMTERDKGRLLDIGDREGGEHNSDAQMNVTLVSVDGTDVQVRHNLGVRNRGHGSRNDPPNNYRLNFAHDRPWKGVTAVNLNTKHTHIQLAGSAIFRMSGLAQGETTAVQARLNGENLAGFGAEMYGSYAHVEVVDSDFVDNHFPDDNGGNAYKCMRDLGPADLNYRGVDPDSYRNSYFKRTNTAEDNWSDLIQLCYVLSDNTPDDIYAHLVNRVVNTEQWLRFLAINTLLDNNETTLANGVGDDYYLYSGLVDPRSVLIQHDLDTVFGRGGSATRGIFRAAALPVVARFLRHPDFVPRYYFHLKDLIEGTFSAEKVGPFLDNLLGDFVPADTINGMKDFTAARNAHVLSLIPSELTIETNLARADSYYLTYVSAFALHGTADVIETRSVRVNNQLADWSPVNGAWDFGASGGIARTLVSRRSVWKYLDDGSDQGTSSDGTNWFGHPDYNDLLWLEGPAELGYGDMSQGRPEATVVNRGPDGDPFITTYFRRSFDVGNASQYSSLHLRLLRDDGAIVYLNGREVLRSNMPDEGVDYLTLANNGVSGSNESSFHDFPVDVNLLSDGTNVFAVEIHQASRTSSDISFDLELEGVMPSGGTGALMPGINRVFVRTFDGPKGTGSELERGYIDIWYDDGSVADLSGTIGSDTTLDAASGPWFVTSDVTVPAGVTLTITPGTTVFFDDGTRLTIDGQVIAAGTEFKRIRLTRQPGSSATWNGLDFHSAEDNRLECLDMEYSSADGESISLDDSRLLIDDVTWAGTDKTIINISNSSLIVRDSIFPDTVVQTVSGHRALISDPYILFENNVFGVCSGDKQDVVDISMSGPSPIPRFVGNVFLGGGDDGLDLDGTSAYIEGNLFMNFHRNFSPEEGESYAITTGYDGSHSSNHVIVRNLFVNCDNAVLVKDGSWIRFENNTVVDCNVAGISFDEPQEAGIEPGRGGYLAGNIFRNTPTPLGNFYVNHPLWGTTDITVNDSLLPAAWHAFGQGNIDADPVFVDPNGDFRLKSVSPAVGTGPCGLDMGAYVPGGAAICGEPYEVTYHTNATVTVGGPGITHYKYALNDPGAPWSQERPVDIPIELAGLLDGNSYAIYAIGKNAAGVWQSQDSPTVSRTWTVDVSYSRLVLNEVLASNISAVEHEGTFPDLIELYYDGTQSLDLAGMSITDDPGDRTKFVFGAGSRIEPGEYVVLHADSNAPTSGIHLGFALGADGEGVYLYDAEGALLDSVEFGLQLDDLSVGRVGYDGHWHLTVPTFGQANLSHPLGDPATLKINEWLTNGEVLFGDDFIELFNPHAFPVDLSRFYLTDNPVTQPDKHQIGPLNFVAGEGFAVFWADNSIDPGHVEFRLSADGEMIGLFDTELKEIDKVLYGPQTTDVSQGRVPDGSAYYEFFELPTPGVANAAVPTLTTTVTTLVAEDADKRVIIPASADHVDDAWKSEPAFDDSAWIDVTGGPGGVGYERGSGYEDLISLDVQDQMYDQNTSCYIRVPFTVDANDLADFTDMTLKVRFDDAFVMYLNGVDVARENFAGTPTWDSAADASHEASAQSFDPEVDISEHIADLRVGQNLLAIHALNTSTTSSDFVISAELEAAAADLGDEEFPFTEELALLYGLRITELMYHAPQGSNFDYIELQNIGETTLNLSGVRLTDGVDFVFREMMLEPGDYVVVVSNPAAFRSTYGHGSKVAGVYSGNLNNGGEGIVLTLPWPLEAAILRFDYSDMWYPTTDGAGKSLVIRDPGAPPDTWSNPESWQADAPTPGGA